jgi:hypothetical protein
VNFGIGSAQRLRHRQAERTDLYSQGVHMGHVGLRLSSKDGRSVPAPSAMVGEGCLLIDR